jgi:20S proteasome alpha/beta subunit
MPSLIVLCQSKIAMRLSVLLLWFLALDLGQHWLSRGTVYAAHSRVQNVVRRDQDPPQDQSIATFSSEGRLLQVEYGDVASQQGSAAVVLTSSSGVVHILVKSPQKVFVIDEHAIMVASGLLGDARWLARVLRQYCQYHRIQQGEPPTLRDIGQYAASDIYHMLTRREGSRPLGCTAILVSNERGLPIQVGQGGAVEEAKILVTGKGHEQVFKAITSKQLKLKGEGEEPNVLRAAIQAMDLKDKETVAVWSIKPQKDGSTKHVATCFLNVDKDNCMSII